jgi:hypothetical protein
MLVNLNGLSREIFLQKMFEQFSFANIQVRNFQVFNVYKLWSCTSVYV